MKYCIIVPDGMADYPLDKLSGRTPIETARTPYLDSITQKGRIGTVRTIPGGFPAGSDIANLTILGYNPKEYYTGRAPLEAASLGIQLENGEYAFRCNFVTANEDILEDFSAGHIHTEEAGILIDLLNKELADETVQFYTGNSYRHIMVYKGPERMSARCFPPHDIMGQSIQKHLPKGDGSKLLIDLMLHSRVILSKHDINWVRIDHEENPANMIWLWGQGQRPNMPLFKDRFHLTGAMITAVDLLKGLAFHIGWDIIQVQGATGYLDTNYAAKGHAAIQALEHYDMVMVHIEAPDEAGHGGKTHEKVLAIEQIDNKIIGPIIEAQNTFVDLRVLVLPDHFTPIAKRTHTPEPVPFVVYGSGIEEGECESFSEANAQSSRIHIKRGYQLIERFISGTF